MFQMKIESVTDIPPTLVKLKVHRKQKTDNKSNSGDWHWKEQFRAFDQFTGKKFLLAGQPLLDVLDKGIE